MEGARAFDKPFLLVFSDSPTRSRKGGDAPFLAKVPGAQGQPHTTIEGGGHFLQEDRGPELAAVDQRLHRARTT
jgi:haloalkane dehalogenase